MTSGFLIFLKGKICHHNNVKKSNFKLICFCHDRKRGLRREGNNARMLIISLPCYNNWISIAISASKHLSLYIIVSTKYILICNLLNLFPKPVSAGEPTDPLVQSEACPKSVLEEFSGNSSGNLSRNCLDNFHGKRF